MNLKFLFNKENRATTILSIVYFILGLMFCILPNIMMGTFETFFCSVCLAYGGITMFAYCISPIVFQNRKIMISSIICIILGILLLLVRSFFVLALAFCILGFATIKFFVLKRTSTVKNYIWYLWIVFLIIYLIVFVVVVVFFALNKFNNISMILIGSCLIFEAVINLIALIRNCKLHIEPGVQSDEK